MADSVRQRKGAAATDVDPVDADEVNKGKVSSSATVASVLPDEGDILTRNEAWVPWLVFAVAAFTRYYRLDQPPGAFLSCGEACTSVRSARSTRQVYFIYSKGAQHDPLYRCSNMPRWNGT